MKQTRCIELGTLGLLAESSGTLATIKERLNHNFGRHQFTGNGVLQPSIARLQKENAILGPPPYTITDSGLERLRTLLREPVEDIADPAHRPHLLLKIGFLHHLPQDAQYDELAQLEDQFYHARGEWIEIKNTHGTDEATHSGYRLELLDLTIELLDTQYNWIKSLRQSHN